MRGLWNYLVWKACLGVGLRYPEGGRKRLCLRTFPSPFSPLDTPGNTLPGTPFCRTFSISGSGWRCGRPNLLETNQR